MIFNSEIKFYGKFRPYQQRALDNLEKYLDNDKIHIVAAPGSGKTILGLELIRRINEVTLVLVPSITIREQWITRFKENFISKDYNYENYISSSILEFKPIMCITYQALFCALLKTSNNEVEEDLVDKENYVDFNLIDTLKKYNVKTICLDECHHLKNEWWKALELTINALENVKIIGLTATPPYDSLTNEWSRYLNLLGPIDEEIFVPELVKDKNLCYHQDFIYYSYPTENETKEITKQYSNALSFMHKYKNNKELVEIVKSNEIYTDINKYFQGVYLLPNYYQSIILFLKENGVSIPSKIARTIKGKTFDKYSFETLLQNVLYDDASSYPKSQFIQSIKKELAALSLSNHRKLEITQSEKVDKILTSSLSKLTSINEIIKYEYASYKDKLRCLILTDYIKINSLHDKIDSFGSVPIFNYLYNQNLRGIRMCLLTGSICIIPNDLKEEIIEIENSYSFNYVNNNYVEIKVNTSNRKKIVSILTSFFVKGYFNVIIGTKSLLGEGWDSPCINSLILASNIGSYVSSNQTRGRAIRIDKTNLNKVSNIWHLVTVNPINPDCNEDFDIIAKRFESFVGVSFDGKTIENGTYRLNAKNAPITKDEVSIENNRTLIEAINHKKIRDNWNECIDNAKDITMLHKVTFIEKKRTRYSLSFYLSVILLGVYLYLINHILEGYVSFFDKTTFGKIISTLGLLTGLIFLIIDIFRIIRQIGPISKAKTISKVLLKTLKKVNAIESNNIKVKTFDVKGQIVGVYLKNASIYEQNLFSISLLEMLGNVEQPRYMICRLNKNLSAEFYVVPTILKKNRESVMTLTKEMSKKFGYYDFVFTKNDENRHYSLKARFLYNNLYGKPKMYSKLMLLKKNK